MLLQKVTIKNFKAIEETSINLGTFTVIVGTNGSGKSSILQALHWVFQSGRNLEVKTNKVAKGDLVARLEFATRGSIGRSIEFCHSAIHRALRRGDRKLTLEDFRRGFDLKRGFSEDGPFDPEAWPVLKDILEKKGWSA